MIPNLYAVIRLQELQDQEEEKWQNAKDQTQKDIHSAKFEVLTDAEFILKFASCYKKDGFDKELASKLKETIYFDGNQRYTKEEEIEDLKKEQQNEIEKNIRSFFVEVTN